MPNPSNQVNARDWLFQVSDGAGSPTWIDIAGVMKFALKPGDNEESTDTTVFASQGAHESQAMQRGATMSVEGRFIRSSLNVRDPGQARIDALSVLVGEASLGAFRFRHQVETLWTVWTGWISPGEIGGENNDKAGWSFTVTRSGAATTAAAP
jgi:hypothetical protein